VENSVVERRQKVALVIASVIIGVSCTIAIDTVAILPWEIPTYEFSWAVSVGDTFVLGVTAERSGDSTFYEVPPALLPVIDTQILITIASLPNCTISSEAEFLSLVETLKVDCTYDNGTNLPSETVNALREIISHHILPIGGWGYIDWLFPNSIYEIETPSNFIYESYLTSLSETHLAFRYIWSYGTYQNYWDGVIYLSTGLPFSIETGESGMDSSWTVRLSEVS
jgi:hypothetical protein